MTAEEIGVVFFFFRTLARATSAFSGLIASDGKEADSRNDEGSGGGGVPRKVLIPSIC